MLALAASEERILLTRDSQLYMRAKEKFSIPSLLVNSDNVFEQLKYLREHFALTFPSEPLVFRCSICNGIIQPACDDIVYRSSEIKTLRSKGVDIDQFINRYKNFYVCASCGKVFWKGRHWREIINQTRLLSA